MATLALPRASRSSRRARGAPTRPSSATNRSARARSLADLGWRSTIRLPCTLPSRVKAAVVSVLSASFVAVPALSRVEPASTSGPTRRAITKAAAPRGTPGLHVTSTESAPRRRASASAARTKRVTPLAAMPTTTSPARGGACPRVVLRALHGAEDRPSSARHHCLHLPRRRVKGGWTLGGLDDAEATAGPRPHEDQPAAALQPLDDHRHRSADGRRCS